VSAVGCFRWQHRLFQKYCIFIQKLQNDPYFAIFGCQNALKTPKNTKKRTFFAFFCKNIWWNEKKAVILHPLLRDRVFHQGFWKQKGYSGSRPYCRAGNRPEVPFGEHRKTAGLTNY